MRNNPNSGLEPKDNQEAARKRGKLWLVCLSLLFIAGLGLASCQSHYSLSPKVESIQVTGVSIRPSGNYWNAGIAKSSDDIATFVRQVEPDTRYQVTLALSPFALTLGRDSVYSQPADSEMEKALDFWSKSETGNLDLLTVLLVDSEVLELDGPRSAPLIINRNKYESRVQIKRDAEQQAGVRVDTLQALKNVSFGFTSFGIRTKTLLPKGEKLNLAVSIWYRGRPIDEVTLSLCADPQACADDNPARWGITRSSAHLTGINSAYASPDASIHLIEVGNRNASKIFGVLSLAENTESTRYFAWTIPKSGEQFLDLVQQSTSKLNETKASDLPKKGDSLAGFIFPGTALSDGAKARAALAEFVKKQNKGFKPFENLAPPRIFVRTIFNDGIFPVFLPLGILAVDVDDGRLLLGQHVRLEQPVALETVDKGAACIRDWELFVPQSGAEFDESRKELWSRGGLDSPLTSLKVGNGRVTIERDLKEWLVEKPPNRMPTLLAAISHHGSSALWTEPGGYDIGAGSVRREFLQSSFAILDACKTADVRGSAFLESLNERGIRSAVVTVSEVNTWVAGAYLDCFLSQFDSTKFIPDSGLEVGLLHWRSQACLQKRVKRDAAVGSNGSELFFAQFGNPHLKVCRPRR